MYFWILVFALLGKETVLSQGPTILYEDCVPGELLEGPTCTTFYICVESLRVNKKVRFDCPPGTSYYPKAGLCDYKAPDCAPDLPEGPTPQSKPEQHITPNLPPGLPEPATGSSDCAKYDLDPESVYDCPTPGVFPSTGQCSSFYACINTMDCIVKGFYVECPKNFLFSYSEKNCLPIEIAGDCNIAQDDQNAIIIEPAIQLDETSVKDFFLSSAYWRFMRYVPEQKQRIIRYPANYSRKSGNGFQMTN